MQTRRSIGRRKGEGQTKTIRPTNAPMRKRKGQLLKPVGENNRPDFDRRSSITPEKSALFLTAIECGFILKEAQQQAGISDDAYRRLLKRSADFRGKLEAAEMKLIMVARSKVANAISQGDMPTVRWYLERKCPEEFRPKHEPDDVPTHPPVTVILPGSRPHPRISPPDPSDPTYAYADD